MKRMCAVLAVLMLVVPMLAGCEQNERVVQRHETVVVESEAAPVVMPDEPQQ